MYTFLKPKNKNVWEATWGMLKNKWQFWGSFIFVILDPFFLIVPILYSLVIFKKATAYFWKEFADINGWKYKNPSQFWGIFNFTPIDKNKELGIMFKQGSMNTISNEIEGSIKDRHFRIFSYEFTIASKNEKDEKKKYYYTVFSFKFNGLFPHIYLDRRGNSWGLRVGEKIPLSSEFEDKFSVFTPKKYEIEALQIFTPDILVALLNNDFPYDVEFVNQEILIFVDAQFYNFEQFEKSFNKALELQDLMSEKLDKFKFEKIGDIAPILK